MSRQDEIKSGLYENVIHGKVKPVVEMTNEGLGLGMTPDQLLWGALIPALEEVGRRFEIGDCFVPEMLVAARAMQASLNILKPLMITEGSSRSLGTCVMGTVKGDMHDIGKNLCNIMLEGAGFQVIDIGINTPPEKFVAAVREHQPSLVGMSAFLTTTMPMFKVTIRALGDAGLREKVKVIVGGAPVSQEYADKMGADGYAPDASKTVALAKRLLGITTESEISQDILAAVATLEKVVGTAKGH